MAQGTTLCFCIHQASCGEFFKLKFYVFKLTPLCKSLDFLSFESALGNEDDCEDSGNLRLQQNFCDS